MGNLGKSKANDDAQKELAAVTSSENPLALVGAGLSVSAGMPTWPILMTEMHAQLPPPPKVSHKHAEALEEETDFLWRAQEYRDLIGEEGFWGFFKTRFDIDPKLEDSDPVVKLVKLPFRHFMTTNYDDVLLVAHKLADRPEPRVLNWSEPDDVRTFIAGLRNSNSARSLLYLHGRYREPKSIVLTDNDYTERYVRTGGAMRRLFAIFAIERVVFIGFSLNDPDLMALLRDVNATIQSKDPRHFAIMGLERPIRESVERNRLRTRYGVQPVFYDNSEGDHAGLIDILHNLTEGCSEGWKHTQEEISRPEMNTATEFYPDDPEKGKWGGSAQANGREVSATVRELDPAWFEATITVRSTDPQHPLEGTVKFFLHPTLIPPARKVEAVNGEAILRVESYGAYTVGIAADGGQTKLELDLSTLKDAPLMFTLN